MKHSLVLNLRSLPAVERFAQFGITQYPSLLYVLIESSQPQMHPEGLHKLGVCIASAFDGVERWAAVLNAAPHISRMPIDRMLVANPDTRVRMDSFFFSPYLTIVGPKATIGSYSSDIKSSFSGVQLMEAVVGDSVVVSLKKWRTGTKSSCHDGMKSLHFEKDQSLATFVDCCVPGICQ